jgi:hypothetical protein
MISALPYEPSMASDWDRFVKASRNGTFLLERGFMDYHADRFTDCSLIFQRRNAPIAILPMSLHREGRQWRSHGGLTYGGLILGDGATILEVMEVFECLESRALAAGVESALYTPIPSIYHRYPSEEDRHALFHHAAALEASSLDTVIDLRAPLGLNRLRRRLARRARQAGLSVGREHDPAEFHGMLCANLSERHDTSPAHSAAEMSLLQSRFPERIALWCVRASDGELLGGTWLFDCVRCVHAQYIASTARGRELGALDLLFESLLERCGERARYFSFGISNEDGGRRLNEGLFRHKTMFGGRGIACETYRLTFG